jgi:uncharacterized membrane protein
MEALIVLLALVALAIPVAVIVLIALYSRLRRDVTALKSMVAALEAQGARILPQTAPTKTTAPEAPPAIRDVSPPSQAAEMSPPASTVMDHGAADATPHTPAARPITPPVTPPITHPATPSVPVSPKGSYAFLRLVEWLRDNWFYAAAAVSLALAGIFFVQYGVETGLLTPTARVIAALVFGVVLIGAGEWIRRRFGDGEQSATAYLPSVLSGAGLVSMMGGVLAARILYDLVNPDVALGSLFAIALFALWLGWRHGPLLAAIGLIGGMGAPFVVGGTSETPEWLLLYFSLLTALGLGIDTLRRWAWVSVLSVVLGGGAGLLLMLGSPDSETLTGAFALYAAVMVVLVVLIPARAIAPDHDGPCFSEAVLSSRDLGHPIFPVILSMGTLLGACAALGLTALATPMTWALSLGLAFGLAGLMALWSRGAPALQDQTAVPLLLALLLIALPELSAQGLQSLETRIAAQAGLTEQRMPWDITLIVLAAVATGLVCAWRSLQPGRFPAVWAGAAALFAPLVGLALEFTWGATDKQGPWIWALHALALAAVMTGLALRFAQTDGAQDRLRTAFATVSALACIAFALTVLLTASALTLALAVVVVTATALDRRFDLPQMTGFIATGIVALGYRLTFDPGLDWAIIAPMPEMLLAYGGTLAVLLAALWLAQKRPRPRARVLLESAAWAVGGMTASLTVYHLVEAFVGPADADAHWLTGLYATIWIVMALAQLERLKMGGALRWLRIVLAAGFGLIAIGLITVSLTFGNPLLSEQTVHGPAILNTLLPAYLLPALALGLGVLRLVHLPLTLRWLFGGVAIGLGVFWIGLVIRHVWQGGTAMQIDAGIGEPELYSYTVALLLAGGGLFYQALARRSDVLRRVGVLVIALAVAKVFLIDISGLAGLVRVFSFLFLGLSLAGLAWLNRWVQSRGDRTVEDA